MYRSQPTLLGGFRTTSRIVAIGLALAGTFALLFAPPATAQAGEPEAEPCEPIVVSITIDWNTFPPTVTPTVWIRPECLTP